MTTNLNIGSITSGVSVTVPDPAVVPGAPTVTIGTSITFEAIPILWTAPESDGGAAITGYNVYAAPHGDPLILVTTVSGGTYAYTFTALLSETEYDFAVEAVNSVGAGEQSTIVSATTLPAGDPPDAPVVAGSAVTPRSVRLTWATPDDNGGGSITGYRVYTAPTGETPFLAATIGPVGFYTIAGLASGAEHDFYVIAVNASGDSAPSSTITVETPAATFAPSKPVISYLAADASAVTVHWQPVDDNGSPVLGFNVYAAPHGDTLVLVGTVDEGYSYEHTVGVAGAEFDFAVEAFNGVGASALSDIATATTAAPPGEATLIVTGATTTSVSVRWVEPPANGSPVTGYTLAYADTGQPPGNDAVMSGGTRRFTFTGLDPDTTYDFAITPANANGDGPSSTLTHATLAPNSDTGEAPFFPFPGMPASPPRYMRSRLWDTTMGAFITELPGARANHIEDPGHDIGGGSFTMALIGDDGDPDPAVAQVLGGRIVQAQMWDTDGDQYVNAYLWRIEDNPKVTVAPTSGQRVITPAGRGVAQDFELVQVDPYGGPGKVPWSDVRSFGWQAPEILDNGTGLWPWGAPNVRSVLALKTSLPPYGLAGKPAVWPNPLSPWLWGQAPVNGADPVGFSYFRYRFTLFRKLDVTFYVTADDLFVAALNGVDIIDFQQDKGDAAGSVYWRKLTLEPGDYCFAARVENLDRPGIAENCGLLNVCATYGISPEVTFPWSTYDTQRFLFTTAGWSAVTYDPAGFYIEPGGPTGIRTVAYTQPGYHSTFGIRVGEGYGTVVEPGDLCPAGTYAEPSPTNPAVVMVVVYPDEVVHTRHGVEVGPSPYGTDAVGVGHPQGWRSLAYPERAPGMSPGSILNFLLVEAQKRGELQGWTWTFNDTVDSSGTTWPEYVAEFTCRVGTTYAEVLKQLEEQGYIYWSVSADSLTLNLYAATHDFGAAAGATFAEGENIKVLTHSDKWGLRRDKVLARTQDGWVRRGSGPRQMVLSIPDWTDKPKIESYLDQQVARTNNDASHVALDFIPDSPATTPWVGMRNFETVSVPDPVGTPYTPQVRKLVADEAANGVGPPTVTVELESLTQSANRRIAAVQDRTAPGAFNGRAVSIAPYTKSQPQGGELKFVPVKYSLGARASTAATNAISDGLTYADSGDDRPTARWKIQRVELTASEPQIGEDPYEGLSIVQVLYNGHVGMTMSLGPGELYQSDYFGSNYINPRTAFLDPYPNWFLETGPTDGIRVQLAAAGTHRNLLLTLWGYEVP